MIWLPATLLAGLTQAWRTAIQQRLRATLSVNAAGLVRYLYGVPFGIALLLLYLLFRGIESLPFIGSDFLVFATVGGLAQILATNLLIMAFGFRGYVVGTAYSKTETIQGAILALVLLGEHLTAPIWAGIAISIVGVFILSNGGERFGPVSFLLQLRQPAALCGLASGFFFALTAVLIKRTSLEVASPDPILRVLITMVTVLLLQTLMQGVYILIWERSEIPKVFSSWRISAQVGLLSAIGSTCWFTGFATAPVALVRSVGQVEVIFTLLFGRFYLRESLKQSEVAGLLLVGLGVILAVIGGL